MNDKLSATGIIVEYNPFHNGHIHHIHETKKISEGDVLIAVMSPNFVQRGEPAFIDKWIRTEYALKYGVDIVIELPTVFALQSAETFAKEAIHLLNLAKVRTLVYGSESLDKPLLQSIDKKRIQEGFSYAASKNMNNHQPNQILGAYYEKYAEQHHIKTHRILRTKNYHDLTIDKTMASASGIRNAFMMGEPIKNSTPLNLNDTDTYFLKDYYQWIRYEILTTKENIRDYLLVDEGIEHLFIKLAKQCDTLEDFVEHATSKRYTRSRIQRTLCHILLKTPRQLESPTSFRVLGMSALGKSYLNQIRDDADFVSNIKNYEFKETELKATFVYGLPYKKTDTLLIKEMGPPLII